MKRLICILLLSCTVLVNGDINLNRKTGKYYSTPMTSDIDQDEYDKLCRKFGLMSTECENLVTPEYTKFIKELNALKARGMDLEEHNRMREKYIQMSTEGIKANDPFWINSFMLSTFLENIDTPTSKRLQEDIKKATYEELEKLDAESLALEKRKSWWNWLFLPTCEDWKTLLFWQGNWRFWLHFPIRLIIWLIILNSALAILLVIGKSLFNALFKRRS